MSTIPSRMTTVTGRLTDYVNTHDFRSVLENKLNAKKSELGETELNLKKFIGNRVGNSSRGGVEGGSERLSSFKGRLGPVVSVLGERPSKATNDRRANIGARLGPRVSESLEEDETSNAKSGSNGFGGEVTGRGSVMSRIVVEQKSRDDALAEQKVDKKETQRNKRMFGSILGTLQRFRADENKDKDRELKKRKIEAKIDQKNEKEREEAVRQKKELFEDKKIKEREIKVLQVQMKRAEEFETWERSKRKEQKYIRTNNSSTKVYFLPKQHNEATLTALENTMDQIDQEIQAAREIFEDELLKISTRADQNPNASLDDLEGDDNSGDENDTDRVVTKSIVSTIKKPNENKLIEEKRQDQDINEKDAFSIKNEILDKSNGLGRHVAVHQNGNSRSSKDLLDINCEKSKNENIACRAVKEEISSELSIKNSLNGKEKIAGSMVIGVNKMIAECNASEVQKSDDIPSLKVELKGDEQDSHTNIKPSPTGNSDIDKSETEKKILLQEDESHFKKQRSRSNSPKATKSKLKRSSSSGERQNKLSQLRNDKNDTVSSRKRKNSNAKAEASKKSKTKKRRESSRESSSTSSSVEHSETDEKSSGTNSSSDSSDSSDSSSSDDNAKKSQKKKSKGKTTNTKSKTNKDKTKVSSTNKKRRDNKNRKNKKYSDSSDSE